MPYTVYHSDEKSLKTLAMLFSPGFMHLGEKKWIESIASEFDLTNKKVLVLGSGTAGAACFLAAHHEAQILGLEVDPGFIEVSQRLKEKKDLQNVTFDTLQLPFPNSHKFDLIISINAISRYKEKNDLFAELHRMLRPNGTCIMMDWFHKTTHYGEDIKAFFEYSGDVFYLNTPHDYLQMLEKNNFNYVNFKETTKDTKNLCEELITELKTSHQGEIVAQFGVEYFEKWLEYWQLFYAALQSGDLISGNVRGVKIK